MKKLLLSLIFIASTIVSYSQCLMSNSSFETWEKDSASSILDESKKMYYEKPKDWNPFISLLFSAFTGLKPGIYKGNQAKTGSYALEFKADPKDVDSVLNGGDVMTLLACNTNPLFLTGSFYTEGFDNTDTAIVAVVVRNSKSDTIGQGVVELTNSERTWKTFSCPIIYEKKEGVTISIMALYMPEDENVKSVKKFRLDGLSFTNVVSVDDIEITNQFSAFPNPFKDQLTLKNSEVGDVVNIFDILGNSVKTISVGENDETVSLIDLPAGIYVLEHTARGIVTKKKVVKN